MTREDYHKEFRSINERILDIDAQRMEAHCVVLRAEHELKRLNLELGLLNARVVEEGLVDLPALSRLPLVPGSREES